MKPRTAIDAAAAPAVCLPCHTIPRGDGSYVVMPGKPKLKITPAEFGRALGVSEMTARRWIHDGTIPQKFVEVRGKSRWWILAGAIEVVRANLNAGRTPKK